MVMLVVAADTTTSSWPQETQSAQCTITAGDVQASAQATISKRLDGVCGSGTISISMCQLLGKVKFYLFVFVFF